MDCRCLSQHKIQATREKASMRALNSTAGCKNHGLLHHQHVNHGILNSTAGCKNMESRHFAVSRRSACPTRSIFSFRRPCNQTLRTSRLPASHHIRMTVESGATREMRMRVMNLMMRLHYFLMLNRGGGQAVLACARCDFHVVSREVHVVNRPAVAEAEASTKKKSRTLKKARCICILRWPCSSVAKLYGGFYAS